MVDHYHVIAGGITSTWFEPKKTFEFAEEINAPLVEAYDESDNLVYRYFRNCLGGWTEYKAGESPVQRRKN
jgi:hypothetical protein